MGYMKHNAIVVTGARYEEEAFLLAHKKAVELFEELVSPVINSHWNGNMSFFIAPDGSKEGWGESNEGDRLRKELSDYIDSLAYGDGSNSVKFVDVSYDEDHDVEVERTNRPIE
ncbi:hypothetical protein HP398_29825 [Brevibacillus sp. HB1.4B]|uniref:hypothetical protein n=1 Tax=Brevibacillus sp. HB1.4B TaxID=2738845 RepID=UPI00156B81AC|nr:hypothetical protein [Brevibacillus sp. HB1.4B]NRS20622.1 hypothetical protein [Brevibacillus sp. HB1.4B]